VPKTTTFNGQTLSTGTVLTVNQVTKVKAYSTNNLALVGQTVTVASVGTTSGKLGSLAHDSSLAAAGGADGDTLLVTSVGTTKATGIDLYNHSSRDDLAFLVGFQIGENKKKGDWSVMANYRQVGLSSVDPNINDSDWALSYTNMAGYKAGFMYSLGDAATVGITYFAADNLRRELGISSGVNAYGPGSGKNSVQVIQLDASVKF
jgi:hypothetical protein